MNVPGCHCLCITNHPEQPGICTGAHELELQFRNFAEGGDSIDVPICHVCAAATLAARQPNLAGGGSR